MFRIPYEMIAVEADRIIVQMVLAPSGLATFYWDMYMEYISACGWSDKDFDLETLNRIDASWESFRNPRILH